MIETTLPGRKIKIGPNVRQDVGDIARLVAEIDNAGRTPRAIVVSDAGELIAGAPELAAWRKSKRKHERIPVRVINLEEFARHGLDQGDDALKLAPSEAVTLARLIEPFVRSDARRRQGHGRTARGRRKGPGEHMTTRDVVAMRCGLSPRTLSKAMHVVDAAKDDPVLYGRRVGEMDDTPNVDAAFGAVIWRDTARLMTQPGVFTSTTIGGEALGKFSVAELRWLIGFFAALSEADLGGDGERNAAAVLTVRAVKRALARAEGFSDPSRHLRPISVTQKRHRSARGA